MKKGILSLVSVFSILVLVGCGSNGADKLVEKVTKENLTFIQEQKQVCDTELTVENKIILKKDKDSDNNYTGEYQFYDCGDGAVYMTLSNGTYKIDGKTIKFKDQYNQEFTFKVTGKEEIVQLDENEKVVKTFKLSKRTESE